MRLVLDANVLVSGLISGRGSPARILELWEVGQFDLVISPSILNEVERVLHYPRIQKRYNLSEGYIGDFLDWIGNQAIIVNPPQALNVIEEDVTDNRYLECAKAGEAVYLVSGDRHLLELGEYKGVMILPPSGMIAILELG